MIKAKLLLALVIALSAVGAARAAECRTGWRRANFGKM
jgi:hypothetical protein